MNVYTIRYGQESGGSSICRIDSTSKFQALKQFISRYPESKAPDEYDIVSVEPANLPLRTVTADLIRETCR